MACSSQYRPDGKGHPAQVQHILATADTFTGDLVDRIPYFIDSAFQSIPNASQLDVARKYDYLASCYFFHQKNYRKTWAYSDSVLQVLSDSTNLPDHIKVYARAVLTQGDVLRLENQFNDAILYYYRGRQFMLKTKDTCNFNEYSKRIAMLYYVQGRYKNAISYFKETFDVKSHCPENSYTRFTEQQGQLANIALCYINLNQLDSAAYYCDSALHYIDRVTRQHQGDPVYIQQQAYIKTAIAVINGTKGEALRLKGEGNTAEQLFREAIGVTDQKGYDPEFAQQTMNKLITLLLEQHRFYEANNQLLRLRQSLDKLPNIRSELLWRERQWTYYDGLGQTQAAYMALKNYLQLKDSLAKATSPLRVIDIQNQFNNISQHYEFTLLKKQGELKTVYLIITLIVFVMTLVIILLILRHNRRSKRHIAELGKLNMFITEQNDHMEESLSALEQSQQENSRMMKIVAHDLRNPVGGMVGMTKYLRSSKDLTKESSKEPLKLMKEAGARALKLIDELLRPDIEGAMHEEAVALNTILQYCVDMLRSKIKEKEQQIEFHSIPITIQANREKLWRVFSNLISNAIKFSPPGGIIIVAMQNEGASVLISVKDQGIGIPASFRNKLFHLSPDTQRTGTSGEHPFGLGLAISKQIVEAHGGSIWYESKEGEGTVFYVRLFHFPK
jgi:signal transduction histidine kinase